MSKEDDAFYAAKLRRDQMDEKLSTMTVAERVEYEQRTNPPPLAESSFANLTAIPTRAERKAAMQSFREAEAAREAAEAANLPDIRDLFRLIQAQQQDIADLHRRVTALEPRPTGLMALRR